MGQLKLELLLVSLCSACLLKKAAVTDHFPNLHPEKKIDRSGAISSAFDTALDSTMAATGVAAMLSSSQRSYRRSSGDAGTRYAAHALPVSCVHIVACISHICDYECVTPTGNTHDHAGPCFITNAEKKLAERGGTPPLTDDTRDSGF